MTTGQTTGTYKNTRLQCEPDIPQRGVNLAKRVIKGLADGNGRITIEVIEAHDGTWLLFVDNGKREVLGK